MDKLVQDALAGAKAWEASPSAASLERMGVFGAGLIAESRTHWFIGDFKNLGVAGLVIFTYADGVQQIQDIKKTMFDHLAGCPQCAAAQERAMLQFEDMATKSRIPVEKIQEVLREAHNKFAQVWSSMLVHNKVVATCAYLNSSQQPPEFVMFCARELEALDAEVRAQGHFEWAPGYLALCNTSAALLRVAEDRIKAGPITPDALDNAVLKRVLESKSLPMPVLSTFLRALSPGAASAALAKLALSAAIPAAPSRDQALVLLDMCQFVGVEQIASKFSGHSVPFPACADLNAKFVEVAQAAQARPAEIVAQLRPTLTGQICALALISRLEDRLMVAQKSPSFFLRDPSQLDKDSLRIVRDLLTLEITANGASAPLLEAALDVWAGPYSAAQGVLFGALRRAMQMPQFSRKQATTAKGPVALAVTRVLDKFSLLDTAALTSSCREEHVLPTLWLFSASPDEAAAQFAKRALERANASQLGVALCFDRYAEVTRYLGKHRLFAVAANATQSMLSLLAMVAVAEPPQAATWWDEFWTLTTLMWDVDQLKAAGFDNSAIKLFLKVYADAAQKVVNEWPKFEPKFDGQKMARLTVIVRALDAGKKLLYLQRSSMILPVVYSVFERGLCLLHSYKFPLPPGLVVKLTAVCKGVPANEVTSEEREVLRQYFVMSTGGAGSGATLGSALSAPSAPSSAGTLSAGSGSSAFSTPRTTKQTSLNSFVKPSAAPPYASGFPPIPSGPTAPGGMLAAPASHAAAHGLTTYFSKVPREDAVAQTLKQMPPRAREHVPEMSRLDMVREQLAQNSKRAPALAKPAGPAPVVHPARPAGFNSRKSAAAPGPSHPSHPSGQPPPSLKPAATQSDSDSSSDGEGLIQLGKRRPRKIETIDPKRSLRPPQADEKAKALARMKARLLVTPKQLHRDILGWEYFDTGSFPPNVSRKLTVPDKFASSEQYVQIMRPLLLMETWTHMQQQKEVREAPFNLQLGNREIVDDFAEFHVTMPADSWRAAGLTEYDLLLLAEVGAGNAGREITAKMPHVLAKVKEGSLHIRNKMADFVVRVLRSTPFNSQVTGKSTLVGERIDSLITMEREYCALEALPHSELRRQILDAEVAPLLSNPSATAQLSGTLGLNQSQAAAVHQATNVEGFSLVQGPPGTGKTKTILGIIGTIFAQTKINKRILVCAPSNAAVDELLMRLKAGIKSSTGQPLLLKLVRLGRAETVNPAVQDLLLDRQIELSVSSAAAPVDQALRNEVTALTEERRALYDQLENDKELKEQDVLKLTARIGTLKMLISEKRSLLDRQREQLDMARKTREAEYKRKQAEVIGGAHIVCATLSGSAHSLLNSLELQFPTVIIDEAAQCVELSALIPMRYGCTSCIMVGDPHQLPPTVLSKAAADLKYEQSLFTRIFNQRPDRVSMLDVQFRMHPEISRFPSLEFYNGKLRNGPQMAEVTARPWHAKPEFPPYCFFDAEGAKMTKVRNSLVNRIEIDLCAALVASLQRQFPRFDFTGKIGIVTPYKQQNMAMRDSFCSRFGESIKETVSFSTIDAFQGQEKDIIIFSTVRAAATGSIGFVGDIRRMNVAITRARSSLWVVGTAGTLEGNAEWGRLLADVRGRSLFCRTSPAQIKSGRVEFETAENAERSSATAPPGADRPALPPVSRPVDRPAGPYTGPSNPYNTQNRNYRNSSGPNNNNNNNSHPRPNGSAKVHKNKSKSPFMNSQRKKPKSYGNDFRDFKKRS